MRIDFAYDGTDFRGYAYQPDVRTVQGEIEKALAIILQQRVETTVAGRTDAGVHAAQQVIHFAYQGEFETDWVLRRINKVLPDDITVHAVRLVSDDFHARYGATGRSYTYRILNAPTPDALRRRTHWHVPDQLDLERMNAATELLIGDHDFAVFCRRMDGRTTTRTVTAARWSRSGDVVQLDISAKAFCYQMVRSIAAMMVDVGRGKQSIDTLPEIMAAGDRAQTPGVAPPHGLVLWQVNY